MVSSYVTQARNPPNYPRYIFYPLSITPPRWVDEVVSVFEGVRTNIDTTSGHHHKSDAVLQMLRPGLEALGFVVESGTKAEDKILRPVLFGELGQPSLTFQIDAFREDDGIAVEVEAGRAIEGNAVYRDLVRMALMVDASSAVIAAPMVYRGANSYIRAKKILDAVYASGRLNLPLEGALLIGF